MNGVYPVFKLLCKRRLHRNGDFFTKKVYYSNPHTKMSAPESANPIERKYFLSITPYGPYGPQCQFFVTRDEILQLLKIDEWKYIQLSHPNRKNTAGIIRFIRRGKKVFYDLLRCASLETDREYDESVFSNTVDYSNFIQVLGSIYANDHVIWASTCYLDVERADVPSGRPRSMETKK